MNQLTSITAAMVLVAAGSPALAQHQHEGHDESTAGHSHERSTLHGGQATMTPNHHFEVLFLEKELRVYVYDGKQNPVADPKDAKVSVTFMMKDKAMEPVKLAYLAPDMEKGRAQGYFHADHGLDDTKLDSVKALVKVAGLTKEPVEFRTAVAMGELVSYACPMNCVAPVEDPMKCPKCGMDMVKRETEEPKEHEEESGHQHHE